MLFDCFESRDDDEIISIVTDNADIPTIIDNPTRLESLISIALKQHFKGLDVQLNYHIDDEGLPAFTVSGGMADIECYDVDCNSVVEVTLMCVRNQSPNEMPAITRHLQEAIERELYWLLLLYTLTQNVWRHFQSLNIMFDILTLTISE